MTRTELESVTAALKSIIGAWNDASNGKRRSDAVCFTVYEDGSGHVGRRRAIDHNVVADLHTFGCDQPYSAFESAGAVFDEPPLKEKQPPIPYNPSPGTPHVTKTYAELETECSALRCQVHELKQLIEFDRTGLASGIGAMIAIIESWTWIPAGEWGCYEWNDQTEHAIRDEISQCFAQALEVGHKTLRESGNRVKEAFWGNIRYEQQKEREGKPE